MRTLLAYLIVCLLIASCGGGGGGGGGSQGPVPASPTPSPFPGSQFSAVFSETNAAEVLSFGLLMPDTAAALAEKHVVALLRNFHSGPEDQPAAYSQFCDDAEAVTLSHIDNDTNAQFTAGDSIDVLIDNCVLLYNRAGASGRSRIDLATISIPNNGEIRIEGTLVLETFPIVLEAAGNEIASFNGQYQFVFTLDENGQSVRAYTNDANDSFSTDDGQDDVNLLVFDASKIWINESGRGSLSFTAELDSSIVGGSFGCETLEPVSGTRPLNLTDYRIDCRDRSNERLLVEPISQGAYTTLGSTELGLFSLFDVVGESIVTAPALNHGQFQFNLDFDQLNLDAIDLDVDEVRNQLLVATTAISPLYPNSLVAVNVESLIVERVLEFDNALTSLWKRKDSNFLYSSQARSGEIIVVSLAEFEEVQRIELDQTGQIPEDGTLPGVVASPYLMHLSLPATGPENLVARIGRILSDRTPTPEYWFTAAYQNGVELPAILSGTPDSGKLHFVSEQLLLSVDSTEQTVVTLGAIGLESRARNSATDAVVGPDLRVQTHYISTMDGAPSGSLDGGGYINTEDSASNRVYSVSDGILVIHDATRRTLNAHYPIPRAERLRENLRTLVTLSNRVVIARDGELVLLNSDELEDNLTDDCQFAQSRSVGEGNLQSAYATCAFTDLVYDSNRNLAYAGIGWQQGRAGRRIVEINPETAELVREFPLAINPDKLVVSVNGDFLFVTTAEQRIVTINLNSGETVSEATTPFLPSAFHASTTEHKNEIFEAIPSRNADDELLVSLANRVGGFQRDRVVKFRAGEYLVDGRLEIADAPRVFYSEDGDLYGITEGPSSTVRLYELADDGNAISEISSVDALVDEYQFSRSDLIAVNNAGINYVLLRQNLLNLEDGSITQWGSDTPSAIMRTAYNPATKSVIQLENPGLDPCIIRSYDLSANLQGEYEIPSERCTRTMYDNKLVSMGADRFAMMDVHAGYVDTGYSNIELVELQFYPLSLLE